MGIAIASGVPPVWGLVTGIIGGILVGSISGSPLQVSGPAAGLAVVVADLVREYGIEVLGAVVLLARLILPGTLLGVVVASTTANLLQFPIQYINISTNLAEVIAIPQPSNFFTPKYAPLLLKAMEIALIASAESLLSAIAVDRLHQGKRTDFDRELTAQGLGNIMCGFVEGTATFIQLPKLATILDRVPLQSNLHLHVDKRKTQMKTNQVQPVGLNLFSTSQTFLTDLSPADESTIKGGRHGNTRGRTRTRTGR